MKPTLKTLVCALLLASLGLSAIGCQNDSTVEDGGTNTSGTTEAITDTAPSFTSDAARQVYEQIAAIDVVTLDAEAAIEAACVSYYALDEAARAEVVNAGRLMELRDLLADFYARTDRRGKNIDRSKILIGAYNIGEHTKERMQEVVDCGIDFMVAADPNYLDLYAEYGVGAMAGIWSFGWPSWSDGGDRPIGGDPVVPPFTADDFEAALSDSIKHDALWGIDIVDEPYAEDFWFFEQLREKVDTFYNDEYLGWVNLFPNYANAIQLGSENYQEHIDQFVATFDTDYICYDHYMYGTTGVTNRGFNRAMENLRIVANACRENDRDMWLYVQSFGPTDTTEFLTIDQLRMQMNTAIAFGAQSIIWGCWQPGWGDRNVYDREGNRLETYENLQVVNAETNMVSHLAIKYNSLDVNIIGQFPSGLDAWTKNDDNIIDQSIMTDITLGAETDSVLCGWFEKRIGEGNAMMFVNITSRCCQEDPTSAISFEVEGEYIPTLHTKEGSFVLYANGDGEYRFDLGNAEYAFVTLDPAN